MHDSLGDGVLRLVSGTVRLQRILLFLVACYVFELLSFFVEELINFFLVFDNTLRYYLAVLDPVVTRSLGLY